MKKLKVLFALTFMVAALSAMAKNPQKKVTTGAEFKNATYSGEYDGSAFDIDTSAKEATATKAGLHTVHVTPGGTCVFDTAAEATNAMEMAELTPRDDVAAMFGGDANAKAAYCAKFEFDVVPFGVNQWSVEAFLKPEEWTNVIESALAATRQIPIGELASHEYGDPLEKVPLTNCVPGFYYSLYNGTAVTNIKANISDCNCNILCGPGTTVEVPVLPQPSPEAGFFSIGVLETPFVIPGATETVTNPPSPARTRDRHDIGSL